MDANTQPNTKAVTALAERPTPFDAVVGYEQTPPGAAYPRGPRKVRHLGTIEWNWGFMHERVSPYYLHRARRHWVLWTKVPDEWERPQWMPLGYVPLAQATREEAAFHLVADSLRFEKGHGKLDRFEAVTSAGHLSRKDWDRIARAIWPPEETLPPIKDSHPVTQWLPVPTGEEHRVAAVLTALHDPAFRWEEVHRWEEELHRDERRRQEEAEREGCDPWDGFDRWEWVDRVDVLSYARALARVEKSAAIRGDIEAMKLTAFLTPCLRRHGAGGAPDAESNLPSAECSIAPHGGVTFHSDDGGSGAISISQDLSLTMPWYYERTWTSEADERLRVYLARPGYIIPRGTGTREAASSMAAIYMALTGQLANRSPQCMSYVIGRWIELVQDEIPQKVRNEATWRTLLPLAARTGRERESERLDVVVKWIWERVLPTLEPVAHKYDIGTSWRSAVAGRSVRSATAGAKAVEDTLAFLGEDVLPAQHDDDLWDLNDAAKAAREIAVASDESRHAGTKDAKGCVDAALKATRATNRTGVSWRTLDPVALLQKMIDA